MTAEMMPRGTFRAEFQHSSAAFAAGFQHGGAAFDVDFRDAASHAPVYDGEYTVTPEANVTQVLYTGGKLMAENVIVQEIPKWETSNEAGGKTVYIGGVE